MNRARVVALLRELADAFEEEADSAAPSPRKSEPRERRPRSIVRPSGEASPDVARRAARALQERGYR